PELWEVRPLPLARRTARMAEAGWGERRADPADRRARRLYLTAKARPVLGRVWNVANDTRDEALARLTPQEAEQLIDFLYRVHATLSDRVPANGADVAAVPPPRSARPPTRVEARPEPLVVGAGR